MAYCLEISSYSLNKVPSSPASHLGFLENSKNLLISSNKLVFSFLSLQTN